jgi:hypothetical protein
MLQKYQLHLKIIMLIIVFFIIVPTMTGLAMLLFGLQYHGVKGVVAEYLSLYGLALFMSIPFNAFAMVVLSSVFWPSDDQKKVK